MSAPTPAPAAKSLVFRSVDGIDIELDFVLPPDASKENPVGILVWWHGGGLLQGSRKGIPPHLLAAPSEHNLCLVSPDYRLAPQTRLPSILSDIAALLSFIRSPAFVDHPDVEGKVDPARVVVSGSSAGGWLALLAGLGVGFDAAGVERPERVQGVAALYPISNLEDPFWTTEQHRTRVTSFTEPDSRRNKFYDYMIQEALLPSLLLEGTGVDAKEFSIARAVREGKTIEPLPPVYLIHGDIDDKVPHRQSTDVVAALRARGAMHEFETKEGKDHLFDFEEDEGPGLEGMYRFIKRVLARE
ncbi:hypothetical protein JCM5296_006735 [Sporobolomyces johnsonii]